MGTGRTELQCLIIGLDAACGRVLQRLFDRGVTPTLESVFDRGAAGALRSQIPPWTPSAWPSLYTGTNPGKHGVFDFLSFDGYDWSVVDATDCRERAVWEYLSDAGVASVVVNAPVTHPPRPFDGALIPGYTAPEEPACHPAGLLDEVQEATGSYRVYPDEDRTGPEHNYGGYRNVVRMRGRAFDYLLDRFEPGFGFLQFQATDTVFHDRPGDWDAVRAVYGEVDAELDRILRRHDPANVLVISDHGIGEVEGYEFRINEFLRQEGYVVAKRGGEGMPSWATVRDARLSDGETGDPDRTVAERAMATAARAGITTQRVLPVLNALHLTPVLSRFVPTSAAHAGEEQVDFRASTAFARSRSELGVRINLAGREPNGQVASADYETVRAELIDLLSGVRTPDGDPVFEDVARRGEYFSGPAADEAVDVVTVPREFDEFVSARLASEPFGEPSQPWCHRMDGIVAAAGDRIDANASLDGVQLFDVAPTVLALFDVPRAARMDGGVLPIVDPAGEREYEAPRRRPTVASSTSDSDVADRLAGLGYLEDP